MSCLVSYPSYAYVYPNTVVRAILLRLKAIHSHTTSTPCYGWQGQFKGKEGAPTVILEAVATQDLRIRHAFFGLPGTNNNINVMERSPSLEKYGAVGMNHLSYGIE